MHAKHLAQHENYSPDASFVSMTVPIVWRENGKGSIRNVFAS